MILLLLFALISREDKDSQERTLKEKQQKLEQEIKNLKQEVKTITISKANAKKATAKLRSKPQVTQAVVYSGSCGKELSKYNWPQNTAYRVMMHESGNDPTNLNDNPSTRDYSVGCFQINLFGANALSRPSETWLKVASNNVSYAYDMYVGQGRTFCTTGGWINTCKFLGFI